MCQVDYYEVKLSIKSLKSIGNSVNIVSCKINNQVMWIYRLKSSLMIFVCGEVKLNHHTLLLNSNFSCHVNLNGLSWDEMNKSWSCLRYHSWVTHYFYMSIAISIYFGNIKIWKHIRAHVIHQIVFGW